jgi:hypothetical protein
VINGWGWMLVAVLATLIVAFVLAALLFGN